MATALVVSVAIANAVQMLTPLDLPKECTWKTLDTKQCKDALDKDMQRAMDLPEQRQTMAACYTAAFAVLVVMLIVYFTSFKTDKFDTNVPMYSLFVSLAAAFVGMVGGWVEASPGTMDFPNSQPVQALASVDIVFGAGALAMGIAALVKH